MRLPFGSIIFLIGFAIGGEALSSETMKKAQTSNAIRTEFRQIGLSDEAIDEYIASIFSSFVRDMETVTGSNSLQEERIARHQKWIERWDHLFKEYPTRREFRRLGIPEHAIDQYIELTLRSTSLTETYEEAEERGARIRDWQNKWIIHRSPPIRTTITTTSVSPTTTPASVTRPTTQPDHDHTQRVRVTTTEQPEMLIPQPFDANERRAREGRMEVVNDVAATFDQAITVARVINDHLSDGIVTNKKAEMIRAQLDEYTQGLINKVLRHVIKKVAHKNNIPMEYLLSKFQ